MLRSISCMAMRAVNGIKLGFQEVSGFGDARFTPPPAAPCGDVVKLGRGAKGVRGTVVSVDVDWSDTDGIAAKELRRRLLEIGFVEGAAVEILHEGFIRRDPIAVRLDDMRVALRRRDADAILVRVNGAAAPFSAAS